MFLDPISLGVTAVSAGLQIFGGFQKNDAAVEQYKHQLKQAVKQHADQVYQRTQNNLLIDYSNTLTKRNWNTQLELAGQQYGFNRAAAARAYNAEDRRIADTLAEYAYKQADMRKALNQAQGYAAASTGSGNRSAQLANAKQNLGNFGRDQQRLAKMLGGELQESDARRQGIGAQAQSADNRVSSDIAIPPELKMNLPNVSAFDPHSVQRPQMKNMGLTIASSMIGAVGTYNSMAPEGTQLNSLNYSFTGKPG